MQQAPEGRTKKKKKKRDYKKPHPLLPRAQPIKKVY